MYIFPSISLSLYFSLFSLTHYTHYTHTGMFKSGTASLTSGRLWKNIKCEPYSYHNTTLSIHEIWEKAVYRK